MNTAITEEDSLEQIGYVARRLGTSPRSVYRLIVEKKFPRPVKSCGSKWYRSDVESYLNRLKATRTSG